MENQVKEKYLAPQIEVIQMETEGTSCVLAGSGNSLGGFGNGGNIGGSSRSRNSRNASSSDLEDMINDILTIEN